MTNRTAPRALSLALAAMVTWSMLAGIDGLARQERNNNALLVQASASAVQS